MRGLALLLIAPAAGAQDDLAAEVRTALESGTRWLMENQEESGAWGSHHSPRPIEVFATVPGSHDAFRVATTGLCVSALLDSPVESKAKEAAIDRAVDYLIENHNVKRVSALEHYNVWSFGYTLRGLGEYLLANPDDPRAESIRLVGSRLIEKLGRYQTLDGGWGYLSLIGAKTYKPSWTSMSFTTATILVGIDRAQRAGVEVPAPLVDKALRSVERARTPKGVFTYGEYWNRMPVAGINVEKGAACRTPTCQYALALFGRDVEEADYVRALEDLYVKHARFQVLSLRRPIPHESWYQISGYFYLYGYAYSALVLEERSEEVRRRLSRPLAEAVLVCRQPDGSFWDYPLYSYHKPYGTAYALIALSRVESTGE